MKLKVLGIAVCVAAFGLTDAGPPAQKAEARSPYGVSGLGSNLHRRFVLKQASKRASRGQPVRNRAITWFAQPSFRQSSPASYRSYRSYRRW